MICPHCGQKFANPISRKGGKTTGPSKARSPEVARASALKRWDNIRAKKAAAAAPTPA